MSRSWALLAGVVGAAYAALFWTAGPVDDDFICYRFARSLVEGRGLAWNGTEQAEGFTVPLWVGLHALGQLVGLDPTVLSRAVGVLAAGASAWVLAEAWRLVAGSRRGGPAWLVALAPAVAFHACAGLGTTLQMLLLVLHAWACLRCGMQSSTTSSSSKGKQEERPSRGEAAASLASGLPLALACLLRQEAAVLVLPLLLGGSALRRLAVLPLGALAAWTGFRLLWFGRLLPLTWSAKKLPLLDDLGYGLEYLLTDLPSLGTLLLVLALLAPRAQREDCEPVHEALAALRRGFLLHVAYVVAVGGDHMAWSRYLVPVFPLGLLLTGSALRGWRGARPLGVAAVLGLQAVWVPALGSPLWTAEARFLDQSAFVERWRTIGRWMRTAAPEGTRVMTSPIGAIGWESRLEVLDLLGLVHEHVLTVEPDLDGVGVKGHHRSATAWVLAERPEWCLLGNGVRIEGRLEINPWEVALVSDPRFVRDYRRVEVALEEGEPLDLFVRRDLPLPAGGRWSSP